MSKEIWCTIGPSSLNDRVIGRLEELGVSLFRLNLSHTKIDDVAKTLKYIQSRTTVPVCLDTEGAQIRTGTFATGYVAIPENISVRIRRRPVPGDANDFNLYPEQVVEQLIVGDLIKIDTDVLLQVIAVEDDGVILWVLNGGTIHQSKAVTVLERDIDLPALTIKDSLALAIGKRMGIRHVALSFANRAADVDRIRVLCHQDATVISKIECLNGLINLSEIVARSDSILIDRGDLSHQVNIEKIPALQKDIIRKAKAAGIKAYVATNLMESMVTSLSPTRAEVNDVFNTLLDGADGLVLAAETAIGNYPVAAASMVSKIIAEFEASQRSQQVNYFSAPISHLIEPHGGCLVNREGGLTNRYELQTLKKLKVKTTDLMDCVQIANGTYSPLSGFMTPEELESVLNTNRLLNGLAWTMPIVLQVQDDSVADISVGDRIALTNENGKVHATLDVSAIYSFDFEDVVKKWFSTTSRKHPGVAKLAEGGNRFVAGEVTLVNKMPAHYPQFELTPTQTRLIFAQKGWSKVVGFHTRNVPHRAHEHIQLRALDSVHADGLYISPVIGPKKAGDFLASPILKSYQLLLEASAYPPGKVVLGAFSTYSRYCGPREAVFTALCRKNLGCSHFIIGRDHTGVDGFYKDDQTRKLFDKFDDIGVMPIFFDPIGFNPDTQSYSELSVANTRSISGTELRAALSKNKPLPDWFIRENVQNLLRDEISESRPVFYS